MSINYNDFEREAGFEQEEGSFLNLAAGSRAEVVFFKNMESVDCNEKELNSDGKFCSANGKTILYTFVSPLTGKIRTLRRNSKGVFIAFKTANVQENEAIRIERTGTGQSDTRYTITRLSELELAEWVRVRNEELAKAEEITNGSQVIESPSSTASGTVDARNIPF